MRAMKEGRIVMRLATCRYCDYKKTVPLNTKFLRCIHDKTVMDLKLIDVGKGLDYQDYYSKKNTKNMQKGKNTVY